MLAWSYRRNLLLQELNFAEADVICLQEIQSDHYELDILPQLQSMGYEGVFRQKARENMGQYGKVRERLDIYI